MLEITRQGIKRRAANRICVACWLTVAVLARSQPIITTLAGNGTAGYGGDGGPAAAAALNQPKGMAINAAGNVYIADPDNARVRKVDVNGIITTFAGTGASAESGDGGPAASASISDVMSVALDSAGNLFIADSSNRRIRKVDTKGIITSIAGTGIQGFSGDGGPATDAMLGRPVSVTVDAAGNVYYVDSVNQRIRRIDAKGIITTIAGSGVDGFGGDGGPAIAASFSFPLGVALDLAGNIYIADAGNNRVREITSSGMITTVAGNGTGGYSGDGGLAVNAALNIPSDLVFDSAGNLYIGDAGNNRVRRVDSSGMITTIAGTYTNGFSGDGGPASAAVLNYPRGLAVDSSGDIYIGDRANNRVRKITGGAAGPPTISAVVNGASFSASEPIAPGSIVSLFGSHLALATEPASSVPLPETLAQTSVTINGVPAPLYFVSPGQVNAQATFELAPGNASLQLVRGSASAAASVSIAPYSPGIFLTDQAGTGAIFHASFAQVNSAAPARPGETVVIYATGLGPLSGTVTSGSTTQANPTTSIPVVNMGGLGATVSYSGLAPELIGVYQVNAMVPGAITAGNQPVQIIAGGATSNTAMMVVAP